MAQDENAILRARLKALKKALFELCEPLPSRHQEVAYVNVANPILVSKGKKFSANWFLGYCVPIICCGIIVCATLYTERKPSTLAAATTGVCFLVGGYVFVLCLDLMRERYDYSDIIRTSINAVTALLNSICAFAGIYKYHGIVPPGLHEPPVLDHTAGSCLYFSVVTWTTLGYGDFTPSPAARPYAAIEGLCGYVFIGVAITAAFHIRSKIERRKA